MYDTNDLDFLDSLFLLRANETDRQIEDRVTGRKIEKITERERERERETHSKTEKQTKRQIPGF